jgi:signal transduction histidine kinase/CheY-like chemotaxis protein
VDERARSFARLFETVHEGVYIGRVETVKGPNGAAWGPARTLASNAHLRSVLGCAVATDDGDVQPFDPSRFVDPDARAVFFDQLCAQGFVDDYLLRLRRNDGTPIWTEVTATAHATAGALHVNALVRDVSARRKLEEQSRDLYHQLLQTEKMAALGQTVSRVAHELNSPLQTILSWAERLAKRPADDTSRKGLDIILGETERAARIVRPLLMMSHKRQSTRMMVDLNDVIRETLTLRAHEPTSSSIVVTQRLADALPEIFADGYQVKQVILNLVINAEQAMLASHGRGALLVRSWHEREQKSVVLEVTDDGPGIADDLQARVFDPFFTTKELGKGTGLGLSVAYAIVQDHGGRIWLSSAKGSGASFFVELPIAGDALQPRKAAQAPIPLDGFKGLRVLVVEDEPALALAVSEALADAGMVVDRAGDGEEGLTRLSRGTYDLIICDLQMPRIDGMQFYRAMAAATPTLARRVIFVTGAVAGTDAERFLEETGCRWLAKPFRLGDLLRAAREALA